MVLSRPTPTKRLRIVPAMRMAAARAMRPPDEGLRWDSFMGMSVLGSMARKT
jgi:hypothetical protein